jgi:hypothetical protein
MDAEETAERVARYGIREELNSDSEGGATSGTCFKAELGGVLYKIRQCDDIKKAEAIEGNCRKVSGLGVIPVFYGRAGDSLVFEFVDGTDLEKDISTEDAYQLGQLLGKINNIPAEDADFDADFFGWLDELYEGWVIGSEERKDIINAYDRTRPAHIETCLDYTDVRHHNFKKRKDGRILAVDDEALKTGYPLGSGLVKAVDRWLDEAQRNAFLDGYASINRNNLEYYLKNQAFVHIYFHTRFAKGQLHSKRGSIEDRKRKINKALRLVFDYTSSS